MKRLLSLLLVMLMCAPLLLCGCSNEADAVNPNLDLQTPLTLRVAGNYEQFRALDVVAAKFTEKYPNCKIEYEYLQSYYDTAAKRLESDTDKIDMFLSVNIQPGHELEGYALELYSQPGLDLSQTHEGLIENFRYKSADGSKKIYAIPLGAEIRGLFVNKTLLASQGIGIPKNRAQFLDACEKLYANGYTPIQGNPGYFGQRFLYPYVCNVIANAENYDEVYAAVNSCDEDACEIFREPLELLYNLVEKNYYQYKYVETEYGMFVRTSETDVACDFFNIKNENETYTKLDDVGRAAFVAGTMSQSLTFDKIKEDYHSAIEYEFILTPLGEQSGFAYMSPTSGIAVNKKSDNTDWVIEFLNFLFTPEINKLFTAEANCAPNTSDTFKVLSEQFDIADDCISQLGQVTFGYDFYSLITPVILAVSKANNPKYMNDDGNGNVSMYGFDYYMDMLRQAFAEQKAALGG